MDKPVQPTTSLLLSSVISPGRLGAALARAVDIASEHRCSMSLIAIAIDDLAARATERGLAAEQLEQQVADTLVHILRNIDIIGYRSGGGLMIITAPAFHFEGEEVATRLTNALSRFNTTGLSALSLSCGVASYQPGDTATRFSERALAALEQARANGGACIVADEIDESTFSP
jgi:GGDEF domain-containing protein